MTSGNILLITTLAGSASCIFANPFWMLNTRLTLEKDKSVTILQTVKKILREEGITAFYKGVLANLILVINPIINFVVYELVLKLLARKG